MVRPAGFEPATLGLEGRCRKIPLSVSARRLWDLLRGANQPVAVEEAQVRIAVVLDATDTGRWRAGRCSDTRRGAGAGAARRRGWALSTTACRTDAAARRSARSPTRRRGPARRAARPPSRRSTAWPRPPRDVGVGVVHPRALTLGVGEMGGCGFVAVASFSSPSCQSLNRP